MKMLKNLPLLLFFALTVGMVSCKKDTEVPPVTANPNPAKNNDLILSQNNWGGSGLINSIHQAQQLDDAFYCIGYSGLPNSTSNTGRFMKINQNGSEIWNIPLGMQVKAMSEPLIFSGTSQVNKSFVLVGGIDKDGDGVSDECRVQLRSADGVLIVEDTISEPGYQLSLTAVNANSIPSPTTFNSQYFEAVGFATNAAGTSFPCLRTFTVTGEGKLFINNVSKIVRTDYPGSRFSSVAWNNGYLYLIMNNQNNFTVLSYKQEIESGLEHHTSVYTFNWNTIVAALNGLATKTNNRKSMIADETGVYVAGNVETWDTPAPDNGGKWSAGLVLRLDLSTGAIAWKTNINLSNYGDFLNGIFFENVPNGNIFVVGSHSGVYYSSTGKEFSNGLLCRINRTSGDLINSYTFGDPSTSSSINCGISTGNSLYMFGFTNYTRNSEDDYWQLTINK